MHEKSLLAKINITSVYILPSLTALSSITRSYLQEFDDLISDPSDNLAV